MFESHSEVEGTIISSPVPGDAPNTASQGTQGFSGRPSSLISASRSGRSVTWARAEPPTFTLERLSAREAASLSWHFFCAFSKAARCFTKHWELVGSSFSKADHWRWALLSFLAWDVVPCPKGLPFLLGGPSGSCMAFPSFCEPFGFLFQERKLSFPRKEAFFSKKGSPFQEQKAFPSQPTAQLQRKWLKGYVVAVCVVEACVC